jgi:muconolactone delta-isomerase
MKFLVLCRPSNSSAQDQMALYAQRELEALRELRTNAELIDSYSPGRPGAVLIFEATDADQVERNLATLPMRQAGLIMTEVIPLYRLDLDNGDRQ